MSFPPTADPFFYDDSDFIECKVCSKEFDHNEYNSFTCSECEDEQIGASNATTIPNSL